MKQNVNTRIAIIGAGASGLTAAMELKERGYTNIVIFEKEKRVGGKTCSVEYKGAHFELGSMMFSREDDTARLADRFHVPYASFETKDFYFSNGKYLNPIAYAEQSYSLFEILRSLYGLRGVVKANGLTKVGYENVDPELFQDFGKYVKKHHFEAAAKAIQPAISGLGYGYFETTPAMY